MVRIAENRPKIAENRSKTPKIVVITFASGRTLTFWGVLGLFCRADDGLDADSLDDDGLDDVEGRAAEFGLTADEGREDSVLALALLGLGPVLQNMLRQGVFQFSNTTCACRAATDCKNCTFKTVLIKLYLQNCTCKIVLAKLYL
jgi:hypothetical protein